MKQAFSIVDWDNDLGTIDLGNRLLTIIPTPGHEEQHICIYDFNTRILFSGDMLYPGRLVIEDWSAYRKTADKMLLFADEHELSYILGAHIEMKKRPVNFTRSELFFSRMSILSNWN